MIDLKQMPRDGLEAFIKGTISEIRRMQQEQPEKWARVQQRARITEEKDDERNDLRDQRADRKLA